MQSYHMTYYRLRKRGPLIALFGSNQVGLSFLHVHPQYPIAGVGSGRFEHTRLAEVVQAA